MSYSLAIHGGAGTVRPEKLTKKREKACLEGLQKALRSGKQILETGGSAMDAVEAAVVVLEDDPNFNAGRGAVFTSDGRHELDAAIMDGRNAEAGSVASVIGPRNPIRVARQVLEQSPHVLISGSGAATFAREQGLVMETPEWFHDDRRYRQWQRVVGSDRLLLDHSEDDKHLGTVGAVARDQAGNLAAATSTGGMTNKRYGRIGDSPLIGSGTYADNPTVAVSCTGTGEAFMRCVAAYDLAGRMRYGRENLQAAADAVLEQVSALGGRGGLIAVAPDGQLYLPFSTPAMYRGWCRSEMSEQVCIFRA